MAEPTEITAPLLKATTAIAAGTSAQAIEAAAGGSKMFADLLQLTWPNLAAAAAFLYSAALCIDFCWRKWWRPLAERVGLIKPKPRKVLTESEWAALRPEDN